MQTQTRQVRSRQPTCIKFDLKYPKLTQIVVLLSLMMLSVSANPQYEFGTDVCQFDRDIFTLTNQIRTDPASYIPTLQGILAQFTHSDPNIRVLPGGSLMMTQEGPAAVNDAIAFCQTATPSPAIQWDQLLGFASTMLVDEQGPTTSTGSTSPTGSTMQSRIETFG